MSGACRGAVLLLLVLAFGLSGAITGCAKGLPEPASPAARLYAQRCGGCHQVYPPKSMTAAMWQIQVTAMASRIAAAGQTRLTPAEEQEILEYLQRNAGTE